jgi:hypothetical protein
MSPYAVDRLTSIVPAGRGAPRETVEGVAPVSWRLDLRVGRGRVFPSSSSTLASSMRRLNPSTLGEEGEGGEHRGVR